MIEFYLLTSSIPRLMSNTDRARITPRNNIGKTRGFKLARDWFKSFDEETVEDRLPMGRGDEYPGSL